MEDFMEVSTQIEDLIKLRLTQEEIAQKAGVSSRSLTRWINKKARPSPLSAAAIHTLHRTLCGPRAKR
jgi:transcriptional regulator with XRE-family HTH domain